MNAHLRPLRVLALAACVPLLLAACKTLEYRDIQKDFNAAVQADNVRSVDALGALTGTDANQRYTDIETQLSDDYIQGLDPRLQPNAYAIRAVAQWRTGKLDEAYQTAKTGKDLPNVASSPRDQIVLTMIPALVIDQQIVTKFKANGGTVTEAEYDVAYADNFETAAGLLKSAAAQVPPAAAQSSIAYVHLQRWRVLQNWSIVISRIDGGAAAGGAARKRARDDAKSRLGGEELTTAISSEASVVPPDDPIRKAMEAIALQSP